MSETPTAAATTTEIAMRDMTSLLHLLLCATDENTRAKCLFRVTIGRAVSVLVPAATAILRTATVWRSAKADGRSGFV